MQVTARFRLEETSRLKPDGRSEGIRVRLTPIPDGNVLFGHLEMILSGPATTIAALHAASLGAVYDFTLSSVEEHTT